ncbi:Phospholipase/carboxylesterase/thioesterase [Delphinella strobiligena]|nr:Phospholipase/carboxylesterase/thioesterase [Delphinella strobiligena]
MAVQFGQLVVIEPREKHTHTCIFLHGRDYTGDLMSQELFAEQSSSGLSLQTRFPTWRWLFPTASTAYNSKFQQDMNEWFDMDIDATMSAHRDHQTSGLGRATAYIHQLMDDELKRVPPSHLFLGGISMGCATAIFALLSCQHRIGGFVGISGWMPSEARRSRHERPLSRQTPIFLSHNDGDPVVDIHLGRCMRDTLCSVRMQVSWKEYRDDTHSIKEPEGIDDLIAFLDNPYSTPGQTG